MKAKRQKFHIAFDASDGLFTAEFIKDVLSKHGLKVLQIQTRGKTLVYT